MAETNHEAENDVFQQAKQEALSLMERDAYASGQLIISALLSLKPDDAFLWFQLFEARRQMGQWPEAIEAFEKASLNAPKEYLWTLYVRRAIMETDRGCPRDAEQWFRTAFACPEIAGEGWPYVLRGANLLKLNQVEDAISVLQAAQNIDAHIDRDELFHMLGSCYLAVSNYREAEICFLKALSFDPASEPTKRMASLFIDFEKAKQFAASLTLLNARK